MDRSRRKIIFSTNINISSVATRACGGRGGGGGGVKDRGDKGSVLASLDK